MNDTDAVKPHACHQCGKNFVRKYNLQRHAESVHAGDCAETESFQSEYSDTDDELDFKKRRFQELEIKSSETESTQADDEDFSEDESESETETTEKSSDESESETETTDKSSNESESETETTDKSSNDDESNSELEDNVAYRDWYEEAKESTEDMLIEKYEQYVKEGMGESLAKEKANRKTLWAVEQLFFDDYKDFLLRYLCLKDNDTHQEIVEDLEEKVNKGMEVNKALNRVIPKYKARFNGLFQQAE